MKAKRLGTGFYRLTGTTTFDGKTVEAVVNVWRHESDGWLSETVIGGRATGSCDHHKTKREAVIAANWCIAAGYLTIPGLGVCGTY